MPLLPSIPPWYAPRQRVEHAFQQYITANAANAGLIKSLPVNVYCGQVSSQFNPPAIVCRCTNGKSPYPPSSYMVLQLEIGVVTVAEQNPDNPNAQPPEVNQELILGEVDALLFDYLEVVSEINTYLPNFLIYGFFKEDEQGSLGERHWVDTLKYEVHGTIVDTLS